MNKALEALQVIIENKGLNGIKEPVEMIETALKDYEKKTKLAKEYADVNNVAKKLKAFEILKQFDAFRVIQVQGQWFIMLGDVFVKSPKIPITEEQAALFTEVLV